MARSQYLHSSHLLLFLLGIQIQHSSSPYIVQTPQSLGFLSTPSKILMLVTAYRKLLQAAFKRRFSFMLASGSRVCAHCPVELLLITSVVQRLPSNGYLYYTST